MWRAKIQISQKCGKPVSKTRQDEQRQRGFCILKTVSRNTTFRMKISRILYERNSIVNPNPDPPRYSISHIICKIMHIFYATSQ